MTRAVLLMAYGTPETPDDVAPYYTHIRGGRTPSEESVKRLRERYEIVGGRTPLLQITNSVRDALEEELNAQRHGGEGYRVYVGMKHWHPFIGDVVPGIVRDGATELVAVALAPHYSRISIGGYQNAVEGAIGTLGRPVPLRFIRNWHLNPGFIELIAKRVNESLAQWPVATRAQVATVFSAHSLPERIREWRDPYEQQLLESCRAVADRAAIDNWRFAWQSAGHTDERWLGPDICDVIQTLHDEGTRHVLSVPIGFVSDHLEILYDLDYEAKRKADALGMTLLRTPMPNVDPAFIKVLASVVTDTALSEAMAS